MKENETDLIIELAKVFLETVQDLDPSFERAFFRFHVEERMHESCASYTTPSNVFIIDALTHDEFFDTMDEISVQLLNEMKKTRGLLLLTIDRNFDYDVQFEYDDMDKWRISLTDGGTGVPAK